MSEEEIINILSDEIVALNVGHEKYEQAIQGLLDLYNKEKEKNKELKEENDTLRVIKKGFLKGQHSNCVQKEKIQEKIRNIKERRDIDGACETALAGFQREAKLDALQELLEERN